MSKSVVQVAKEACRELRKRSTQSEKLFWQAVRNRQVLGKKFLRQFPIFFEYMDKKTFFIADFYCHANRLVVEIDGKSHDYQEEYDELRTYIINNLDIEVVRFKNEEIERGMSDVVERLRQVLTHPKSLS
jgi:very-short-patch-repair endonuclease